jgi:hypothetical protein
MLDNAGATPLILYVFETVAALSLCVQQPSVLPLLCSSLWPHTLLVSRVLSSLQPSQSLFGNWSDAVCGVAAEKA